MSTVTFCDVCMAPIEPTDDSVQVHVYDQARIRLPKKGFLTEAIRSGKVPDLEPQPESLTMAREFHRQCYLDNFRALLEHSAKVDDDA
jgi:hypothetical protein